MYRSGLGRPLLVGLIAVASLVATPADAVAQDAGSTTPATEAPAPGSSGAADATPAADETSTADAAEAETGLKAEADNARGVLSSILLLLLTVAGLAVVPYVLWRMRRASTTPQLIVEAAKDATGDTSVKERLEGLSSRFREDLADRLKFLDSWIMRTDAHRKLVGTKVVKMPLLPRTAAEATVESLTASLKGLATDTGGPIVQFLTSTFFRPTGRIVSLTLGRTGIGPDRARVALGIADLRDAGAPVYSSLDEPSRQALAPGPSGGMLGPPPSPPVGETLLEAAEHLREALLVQDATALVKEAIVSPDGQPLVVAPLLEALLSEASLQTAASLGFKTGKGLEDAGFVGAAIHAYVAGLPLEYQGDALDAWTVALAPEPAPDAADALVWLAGTYLETGFLRDESQDLLRRAAEKGSPEANELRAERNQAFASSLVSAATGLTALQRYSLAKSHLTSALKLDPRSVAGAELQAYLAGVAPDQDDASKKAAAQVTIGAIYAGVERRTDAETAYKEAISSRPQLEEAQAGLRSTLAIRSLDERFSDLTRPAAWLLALELLELELIRTEARRWWTHLSPFAVLAKGSHWARAEVERRGVGLAKNYVGVLLQASRGHPTLGMDFLDRAVPRLGEAIDLIPDYYQPHENLADTYLFKAKKLLGTRLYDELDEADQSKVDTWIGQGIEAYEEGLRRLDRSDFRPEADRATAMRLLKIDLAVALLLEGPHQATLRARTLVDEARSDWSYEGETNARVIFNFASVFGRLRGVYPNNLEYLSTGRRMLAFAMGRDGLREYWRESGRDPDLASLLDGISLDRLQRSLRARDRCLYLEPPDAFVAAMQAVMNEAGWPP